MVVVMVVVVLWEVVLILVVVGHVENKGYDFLFMPLNSVSKKLM